MTELSIEQLARDMVKDYTSYITKNRVLPSLDLKPVHRRIIWSMIKVNARFGKGTFRKSAPITGQCFTGDTEILLLDGTNIPIKDLVDRDEFYLFSCKPNGEVVPGRGHSARITKYAEEIIQLTLNNNKTIQCTPDHRFMLRDGTYIEAQYLTNEDSLMSLFRNDHRYDDHAIKSANVIKLETPIPVYDITVDKYHNFSLSSGMFVHNCMYYHPHGDGGIYGAMQTLVNSPNNILEGRGNWGSRYGDSCAACFTKDTKISLLDGRELSIENIMSELNAGNTLYSYSVTKKGMMVPGKIIKAFYSGRKKTIKLILDNGEIIRCTPDHRFMMRDGSYKEAYQLTPEDSLMPINRKLDHNGYEVYFDINLQKWLPTHVRAITPSSIKINRPVRHHVDFNKRNNNPENLVWMNNKEHFQLHNIHYDKTIGRPEVREKVRKLAIINGIQKHIDKPEFFSKIGALGAKSTHNNDWFNSYMKPIRSKNGTRSCNIINKQPDIKIKQQKGRILGCLTKYLINHEDLDEKSWNLFRNSNGKNKTPSWGCLFSYFDSAELLIKEAKLYNHRILNIEICKEEDVYDIEIDNDEHNFLLSAGVIVHNSRYTECRTSELFELIFDESMLKIGEFQDNFDETEKEPVVIQTKLPLPLLIGVSSIGVGLTSNLPAYSIMYIKELIKAELSGKQPIDPVYAYGGCLHNNRIYPNFKQKTIKGKKYLHITGIPVGSSIGIIGSDVLIHELISSKNIEIIDDSSVEDLDIKICAPEYIQKRILMSASKPVINNFKYYWKRIRSSGYIKEWLDYRKSYILRREYYKHVEDWKKNLISKCLTQLSIIKVDNPKDYQKMVGKIVGTVYTVHIKEVHESAKEFIPTEADVIAIVRGKSISQIKEHIYHMKSVCEIPNNRVNEIILEEIESIPNSFSKHTVEINDIKYAPFKEEITRYAALRHNGVEIRFRKIPRVLNWEIKQGRRMMIVFSDGSTEKLDDYFFGVYESGEKRVVGFMFHGEQAVVLTESDKLQTITRLSYLAEPIKSIYPAKKIEVNGKEKEVKAGMYSDKVNSLKILEV